MSSRIVMTTLMFLLISGCATTKTPPISEKIKYVEAKKTLEPVQEQAMVEISTIVPLPGQLKELPEIRKHEDDASNTGNNKQETESPLQVIEKANHDATQNPTSEGYFNAIMKYDYDPGALYQVYCAPLKLTDIQMQPGEEIQGNPAAGDTVRWIMGIGKSIENGVAQQHLYIKPTRTDLYTTLSVNTNKRFYHIELHSYKDAYMAAVNWRYPQDEIDVMKRQAEAEKEDQKTVTATNIDINNLNFNYAVKAYKGDMPSWKPVLIFDDGKKVFIKFPKGMLVNEAPVLFVVSDTNQETQLVNYRVKNEYYIVDRLFKQAALRLGQKDQTIIRISKSE
jgi:type IV secretion system protein TrbG